MTTPHTPAALDVAAIEARAAAATPGAPDDRAWGPHVARWRDSGSLNPYADDLAHAVVEQEQTLALICEDNAMLLAALRTLTAQHAADVAAAVARTTPPTEAEAAAHNAALGWWLISRAGVCPPAAVDAFRGDGDVTAHMPFTVGATWLPLDASGRPCPWPTPALGATGEGR